ncbi:MAG: TetR/AcrR family transcriptional regulator [bacterium]|nr:TetR/AcrR family transcriptional regulator [bacterium]
MDKRKRLLESALKLFVEFGFHETPTSKIAKEAGIANGTLFYFFATKDALVIALYTDIKSQMMAHVAKEIENKTSLKEVLKGYYSASLEWAMKHKTKFRFIEQFTNSTYLNKIADEAIQEHLQPIYKLLKQGFKNQVIQKLDVDMIFALVSGHTFSINQYLVTKDFSKNKQAKVIDETFELLWKMLT